MHWKPLPHKSGLWHLTILVEARRQGQPQHTSMAGAEAKAAAGAGLPFPSIPFSLATTSHSATAEVMERHLDTDSDTMPGRGDVLAAA